MLKKILLSGFLLSFVTACSGAASSHKVNAMQRKDKNLSCKEILLEMNEAEFYRKSAYDNRGLRLRNMLMPLGYISTYMNADEAIKAAEARVEYLDRIYEIMDCDNKESASMEEQMMYAPANHGGARMYRKR